MLVAETVIILIHKKSALNQKPPSMEYLKFCNPCGCEHLAYTRGFLRDLEDSGTANYHIATVHKSQNPKSSTLATKELDGNILFFWIQSRPRLFWSKIRFYQTRVCLSVCLFLYIVQLITYSSNFLSNQKWHKSAQNELPQKYTNQQIFSPNIKNYTHILSFYSQYSPIKISSETYLIKKKITKKKKEKIEEK